VYRPALDRDECYESLTCGGQLDRLLTSMNGELTQQLQRELFGHTLIVDPASKDGMRSPLPVFGAGIVSCRGGGSPAGTAWACGPTPAALPVGGSRGSRGTCLRRPLTSFRPRWG